MDESDITEIINNTKEAITKSESDNQLQLNGDIKFELAVIAKKEAGGKLKFIVAEAGGDYNKETVSKISFSMTRPWMYQKQKKTE